MDREDFFNWWSKSEPIRQNITAVREFESAEGDLFSNSRVKYPHNLVDTLNARGISSLYSHQVESLKHASSNQNVVITTGTSSGKTLCYNLAVLDRMLRSHRITALYIFPTKALAHDQVQNMRGFISDLNRVSLIP